LLLRLTATNGNHRRRQRGPAGRRLPGPATAAPHRLRRTALAAVLLAVSAAIILLPAPVSHAPALARADTDVAVPPAVASAAAPRRVMLVFIDRIGLDDLAAADTPNIDSLVAGGASGLMNVRVWPDRYGTGSYLVIGAGGRVIAGENAGLAFNAAETLRTPLGDFLTAGDIYRSRTGIDAPRGEIVNLSIEEIRRRSESPLATSTPGLLGQTLRDSAVRVSLLGNADSLEVGKLGLMEDSLVPAAPDPGAPVTDYPLAARVHREAACAAMDTDGRVPSGDVSSALTTAGDGTVGFSTDFAALVELAALELERADLLVIDMGQTSRVDEQAANFSDTALAGARGRALRESDAALGGLVELLDFSRDLVIVATPTPSVKMIARGELLTPLIIRGPGYGGGGNLSSPTTRREGLVSNFDIAPTILDFLGVGIPTEMEGRVFAPSGSGEGIWGLTSMRDRAVFATSIRPAMMRFFVFPAVALLLIAILVSLLRPDLLAGRPGLWSWLFLSLLSGPLAYLLVPALPIESLSLLVTTVIGAQVSFGLLALSAFALPPRLRRKGRPPEGDRVERFTRLVLPRSILLVSGLTLAAVLLDPLVGSPLSVLSPFGRSLALGGRFYGIGNIYMGVALGAAILSACLLPAVFPTAFGRPGAAVAAGAAILTVTVAVLGAPGLGANVGGLITGVIAAPVTLLKLGGRRVRFKHVAAIAVALALVIGALLLVDLLSPGPSSHAGRAFERISENGLGEMVSIAGRKLQANVRLLASSNWRFFLVAAIAALLVWHRRLKAFDIASKRHPSLSAAWYGLMVAGAASLTFNDSGIEPASAITLFLAVPLFLLALPATRERRAGRSDERDECGGIA
jgi:hypothetical protein